MEILNNLKEKIDSSEERIINDIDYCLKMISSNKLYDINLDLEMSGSNSKNNDVI